MIDLSKIEDPALREKIRADIKADKEATIQKRIAKVKTDEETQAKLDKLKSYEDKEQEETQAAALKEQETVSDTYLTNSKVNLEVFKDMKKYDKFLELKTDEERKQFIGDLKESKPSLFKKSKTSLLSLSNVDITGKKALGDEVKVY